MQPVSNKKTQTWKRDEASGKIHNDFSQGQDLRQERADAQRNPKKMPMPGRLGAGPPVPPPVPVVQPPITQAVPLIQDGLTGTSDTEP